MNEAEVVIGDEAVEYCIVYEVLVWGVGDGVLEYSLRYIPSY